MVNRAHPEIRGEILALRNPTAIEGEKEAPEFTYVYEIKAVAIPLSGRFAPKSAYAQFNLVLDCPSAECQRMMEVSRAKVRNDLFESSAGFTVEDFHEKDGFVKLKASFLNRLDEDFGELAPRGVVLRDWVVN